LVGGCRCFFGLVLGCNFTIGSTKLILELGIGLGLKGTLHVDSKMILHG
jgi:hypothetical protein